MMRIEQVEPAERPVRYRLSFTKLSTFLSEIHVPEVQLAVFSPMTVNDNFYAPGLKGPPGASSNWIVCLSVIPSRLQTKCNILSLGDDTVTELGL